MASIQLKDIQKSFSDLQVIKGIDLDIREGELVVLVGPSGCGKSTLLRILAGLEDADSGSVFIDGADVTDRLPSERGLSMVFQSYALYPHMTVSENIGFALKTAGMAQHVISRSRPASGQDFTIRARIGPTAKTVVRRTATTGGNRQSYSS